MSAVIVINFAGGTATGNTVVVALSGCTVSPSLNAGATVAMASALTNVTVLSSQVEIATGLHAQFNGSLSLSIAWASGAVPAITLNNLASADGNPATVMWPTATGQQTQILSPGNPTTLSGIVSS